MEVRIVQNGKFVNKHAVTHDHMLRGAHLFRKSTDAIAVVLELSDMFSTSTSNPMCHISVFTAYLQPLNSVAVQAHELGMPFLITYII